MSANPQIASTLEAFNALTSQLGTPMSLEYGGANLTGVFKGASNEALLSALTLAESKIDVQLALPTATGESELTILGTLKGIRFSIASVGSGADNSTVVNLFPETSDADPAARKMEAAHTLADSLFATHPNADQALLSYIARRLGADADPIARHAFAGELSSLMTEYTRSLSPSRTAGVVNIATKLKR